MRSVSRRARAAAPTAVWLLAGRRNDADETDLASVHRFDGDCDLGVGRGLGDELARTGFGLERLPGGESAGTRQRLAITGVAHLDGLAGLRGVLEDAGDRLAASGGEID